MSEFGDIILKLSERRIRINRNGKSKEISRLEALVEKEHESALKGTAYAQNKALQRIEKAQAEKEARVKSECDAWGAFKSRQIALRDTAVARGEPPPRLLPDPADILIDRRDGVRILGPIDEDDLTTYDQQLKMREALFLQDRIDSSAGVSTFDGKDSPTSPLILALFINQHLPPSLRLSETETVARLRSAQRLSLRDALKACRSAWRAAGMDVPRGRQMLGPAILLPILRITVDFVRETVAAERDGEAREEAVRRAEYRLMTEVPMSSPRLSLSDPRQSGDRAQ